MTAVAAILLDLDTEDDYRALLEGRPPRAGEGVETP